jgi:hypothetical protein
MVREHASHHVRTDGYSLTPANGAVTKPTVSISVARFASIFVGLLRAHGPLLSPRGLRARCNRPLAAYHGLTVFSLVAWIHSSERTIDAKIA